MIKYLVTMLLICPNAYAGMDFTSLSSTDYAMDSDEVHFHIPIFFNAGAAIRWANYVKWHEPTLENLIAYIQWMRGYSDVHFDDRFIRGVESRKLELIEQQIRYCSIAKGIMENYKKHGVKGDSAQVGSEIYIGEEPLKGGVNGGI